MINTLTLTLCIHIYGGVIFLGHLLHDGPGDGGVGAVQDLSHQHGFEEGPGDGSPCGVDHVQVHVHAEGSCGRETSLSAQVGARNRLKAAASHLLTGSSRNLEPLDHLLPLGVVRGGWAHLGRDG